MVNLKIIRFVLTSLVLFIGIVNAPGTVIAQSYNREMAPTNLATPTSEAQSITYPGPMGGSANDLAMDPKNPNTLYAASNYGVFKTIDGGDNWSLTGLTSAVVYALAIDPINTNNIYAATRGNGVYKTTNGGTTWTKASSTLMDGAIIYTLVVDPANPQNIYAGGRGFNVDGSFSGDWGGGAYKSRDGGSTWVRINNGLPEGWVYTLAIDPTSTQTIYAGTHSQGVYKSFDGGATWASRNGGLNNFPSSTSPNPDNLKIRSISISVQNPKQLLLAVWGGGSLFKSDNGAEQGWINITKNIYGFQTRTVKIDPTNAAFFYAGFNSQGLYKNISYGDENWGQTGIKGFFKDINAIVVNPVNDKIVFVGVTGAGIYRTKDGGANWAAVNKGFSATTVSQIVVDNKDPSHIVAATYGTGVFQSHDKGATWSYQVSPGQWDWVTSVAIDPVTPSTLYIGTDNYGMGISTDGGTSWDYLNHNLPSLPVSIQPSAPYAIDDMDNSPLDIGAVTGFPNVTSVAAAATTPETLFAGTAGHGAYYSLNGGIAWYNLGDNHAVITSILIYPNNVNNVLITTGNQGLILTSYNGSQFNVVSSVNGLATPDIQSAAIDISTQPATLYAGTTQGIYKSINSGSSWTLFGLSQFEIDSIGVDPFNKGIVFAGTSANGIYEVMSGIKDWFNLAMPNTAVAGLILPLTANGTLYAATNGGGVALISPPPVPSTFITNLFIRIIPAVGQSKK